MSVATGNHLSFYPPKNEDNNNNKYILWVQGAGTSSAGFGTSPSSPGITSNGLSTLGKKYSHFAASPRS